MGQWWTKTLSAVAMGLSTGFYCHSRPAYPHLYTAVEKAGFVAGRGLWQGGRMLPFVLIFHLVKRQERV